MSSSDSSIVSEIVAASDTASTLHTIYMVIASLLVYDAILCMDMEVRCVWRAPKASRKLSRLLYMYNRYMSILWNLLYLGLIGTVSDTVHILFAPDPVPPSSCDALNRLGTILNYLALLGPAAFTTLRVYALSGTNKILTGIVLLLSMGPFVVNVSTWYQHCGSNRHLAADPYCPPDIDTSLATVLSGTDPLGKRTLVAMNIADIVLKTSEVLITADIVKASYVADLIDPISSILNSRFLLALYETNAYLERGGSSASSFSTLDFGEADPRATGSPELPAFLNSLAGPIHSFTDHSFTDHDPELFDPESTTVQQEREGELVMESQSEVAQARAETIEVGEGSERV
ncbi:hypothetical protein VTO73DRAFT_13793 [Trametes versicolor]